MENNEAIRLEKVSKHYGGRTVLDEVSLSFERGKTHVLLGSSGCGKSTLLRLILGLIRPSAGHVWVNEIGVTPSTQSQVAVKIGYVVQEGGLFPHFTAEANITLGAKVKNWTQAKSKARLKELLVIGDLDPVLLDRYPTQLSGGQRQRVGLLRALMLDPAFLLLDEPLGALDPMARAALQAELKKVFNTVKKTVVLVTHDIREAAFFGHSISLMHEGKVVQKGTFAELVKSPASSFVTEFLHSQSPTPEMKALM